MKRPMDQQNPHVLGRDDGIPLYLKVASLLRERILRAEVPRGCKLAPIPQLQAEYGVARSTIRQAPAILEDEKLISSNRGRGTIVTALAEKLPGDLPVYNTAVLPPGITFKVLWRRECDRVPEVGLNTEALARPLMHIRKRNDFKSIPYSIVDLWIPRALYNLCPKGSDRRKLYSQLLAEHAGIASMHGRQIITIVGASYETAQLLGISLSAPVARISSQLWDESGTPVMAHVTAIRSDLFAVERSFGDVVTGNPLTWRPKMPSTQGDGEQVIVDI